MLGRLRLGPQSLRGRKFPEPAHPYRSDFQRDRDRVIHSRAFRRLEGKTQVFAAGLSDHFRNRLTHTIEVSQVARTVAVALNLNEEYTETLALAHDLGHPPFAHVGEKELDRQMQSFGSSFEHNRHSLRIVDLLEQRYARFDGLNLTFEVREGIVKHSREISPDGDPELDELLPGERPPLEAQLLDLADEIAYNTADIDDAFSTGLFSLDDVSQAVPIFAELSEQVDMQFPGASDRVRFWEIQRQVIGKLVGGLIEGTVAAANALGVETLEDVRALQVRLAKLTPQAAEINSQLRALLIDRVYSYVQLVADRSAAVKKMGELFTFLLEHPDRVTPGYREKLSDMPVHRVVCDYIAGMTDAYFMRTYEKLLGG
ncbi:MAG: dNTP triphosphohydrolase [Acidobacteriaceae bacterium]|nr:dNTP triphosphohydrolase [Acidobacteriaceae bacterium]MBV9781862.1 dNTP triphosphohydrolase [Acidobacteriaceae bacterium]